MARKFGERRLWENPGQAGDIRTILIPASGSGVAVELFDGEVVSPELHEQLQLEFEEFCGMIDRVRDSLS